jgi:hypothetical protein
MGNGFSVFPHGQGTFIDRVQHENVRGPVHIAMSEHWVLYAYRDRKQKRNQLSVIELFDAKGKARSTRSGPPGHGLRTLGAGLLGCMGWAGLGQRGRIHVLRRQSTDCHSPGICLPDHCHQLDGDAHGLGKSQARGVT